jgi:hypothetical protein
MSSSFGGSTFTKDSFDDNTNLVQEKKISLLDKVFQKRDNLGFSSADLKNRSVEALDADTVRINPSIADKAFDPNIKPIDVRLKSNNFGESFNSYEVNHGNESNPKVAVRLQKQRDAIDNEWSHGWFNPATNQDVYDRGNKAKQVLADKLKQVNEGKTGLDFALDEKNNLDEFSRHLGDMKFSNENTSAVDAMNTPELNAAYNTQYNFAKINKDGGGLIDTAKDFAGTLLTKTPTVLSNIATGTSGLVSASLNAPIQAIGNSVGGDVGDVIKKVGDIGTGYELQNILQNRTHYAKPLIDALPISDEAKDTLNNLKYEPNRLDAATDALYQSDALAKSRQDSEYRSNQTQRLRDELGYKPKGVYENAMALSSDVVDSVQAFVENPRATLTHDLPANIAQLAVPIGVTGRIVDNIAMKVASKTSGGVVDGVITQVGKDAATKYISSAPVQKQLLTIGGLTEGTQAASSIVNQAEEANVDPRQYIAPAIIGGAITGLIGAGSNKLLGATAADALVGVNRVKGSAFTKALKAVTSEGLVEEFPQSVNEQVATNIALGKENVMEGVGQAGGSGAIVGGLLGGGMHTPTLLHDALQAHKTSSDTQTPTESNIVPPEADLEPSKTILDRYSNDAINATPDTAESVLNQGIKDYPYNGTLAEKQQMANAIGKALNGEQSPEFNSIAKSVLAETTLHHVVAQMNQGNPTGFSDVINDPNTTIEDIQDSIITATTDATSPNTGSLFNDIGRTKDKDTLNILKDISTAKQKEYAESDSVNDPYVLATTGIETKNLEPKASETFSSIIREDKGVDLDEALLRLSAQVKDLPTELSSNIEVVKNPSSTTSKEEDSKYYDLAYPKGSKVTLKRGDSTLDVTVKEHIITPKGEHRIIANRPDGLSTITLASNDFDSIAINNYLPTTSETDTSKKDTAISALTKTISKVYSDKVDITPATEKTVKQALNTINGLVTNKGTITIDPKDTLEEIHRKILPTFGSTMIEGDTSKLSPEFVKSNNELVTALKEYEAKYLKGKSTEEVANDKLVGGGKLPSYKEHLGLIQLALSNNIDKEFIQAKVDKLAKWVAYDSGRADLFNKLANATTVADKTKYTEQLQEYQKRGNPFTDNDSLKFTSIIGTKKLSEQVNSEAKIMTDAVTNIQNQVNTHFGITSTTKSTSQTDENALDSTIVNQDNTNIPSPVNTQQIKSVKKSKGKTKFNKTLSLLEVIGREGGLQESAVSEFIDEAPNKGRYPWYKKVNSKSKVPSLTLDEMAERLRGHGFVFEDNNELIDKIQNDLFHKGNYANLTYTAEGSEIVTERLHKEQGDFEDQIAKERIVSLLEWAEKTDTRTFNEIQQLIKDGEFEYKYIENYEEVLNGYEEKQRASTTTSQEGSKGVPTEEATSTAVESSISNETSKPEEVITSEDKTSVIEPQELTEVQYTENDKYQALRKLLLTKDVTLQQVLFFIGKNSNRLGIIAKHLLKILPKDIKFLVHTSKEDPGFGGLYTAGNNTIHIAPETLAYTQDKNAFTRVMGTVIHETLHAVTENIIDFNPEVHKQLRTILDKLESIADKDGWIVKTIDNKRYAFNVNRISNDGVVTDVHEIITYGFTDYHLNKILNDIEGIGSKSLWDRFISLVSNLLGFSPKENTLLSNLIESYLKIINENVETEFEVPTKQEFTPEYQKEIKEFKLANIAKLKKGVLSLKPIKRTIPNPISQIFSFNKVKDSLFGKYPRLFQNLFNLLEFTINTKDGLKAFETLKKEEVKFQEAFKKSYLEKPFEDDPLIVLANQNVSNGKFDPNIVSAMFMGSIDWLMNKGNDTLFNFEKDVQFILSMDENTIPQNEISNALSELGSVRAMVATGLGNNIFNLMKFTASKTYPENEIAKLKLSLGLHALNTLNNMGYVTYSVVENSTFDRFKLNEVLNPKVTTQLKPSELQDQSVVFVRIASDIEDKKSVIEYNLKQVLDTLKAGSKDITSMFESAYEKELPRTKKPNKASVLASLGFNKEKGKKATGLHTTQEITPERIDALTKYVQTPHTLDTPTMKLYLAMNEDARAEMELGVDFQEQKQQSKERSYRGKVLSYEKEKEALDKLLELSEQGSKPLYFMSTFWNQGRIGGIGVGHPQNNKWIRNLSSPKNYFVKIKPSDEFAVTQFKLAVLEAFGVAAKSLTKEQINPKFQEILEANQKTIDEINKQKEGKEFDQRTIINAVHKGKEKAHTLNGLVALSMYSATKEFETNIGREVDGITNGVLIGLVLLAGVDNFERMKDVLAAAGLFEDPTMDYATWKNTIKEKDLTNEDNYEQIARVFAEALDREEDTAQLRAIKHFVGELIDAKGKITKPGRTFAKPILLLTMFGKSTDKLANSVGDTVIATFYDELEKLFKDTNLQPEEKEAKLEVLKTQIQTILGTTKLEGNRYVDSKVVRGEDNKASVVKLTLDNLLEFSLIQKDYASIVGTVNELFRESIQYAINYNFGHTIENRKILNDAYFVVGEVFKLGLKKELLRFQYEQYIKLHPDNLHPTRKQLEYFRANEGKEPSAEQMDKIIADLIKIQPRSPTKNSESLEQDLQLWNSERSSNHTAAYRTQTGWNSKTGKLKYTVTDKDGEVHIEELDLPKSTTAHALSLIINSLGVGVTIANIHNRDSNVMIDMMKSKFKGLAVHDAFIFNLLEAVEGSKLLNSSLIDSLNSFDVFQGAVDNLERVQEYMQANPDIAKELNTSFIKADTGLFNRQGFYIPVSKDNAEIIPHYNNLDEFVERLKSDTRRLAIQRQKQIWNNIPVGGVMQYGGQDSNGSSEILDSVDPRLNIFPDEYAPDIEVTPTKQELNFSSMAELTDHSGGAYGADTDFDLIGREFGVKNFMHYRDSGNEKLSTRLEKLKVKATVLTKTQMEYARQQILKFLKKDYSIKPEDTANQIIQKNLQVRNFYQVNNAESIFAIAKIKPDYKTVEGGTGTAVELAKAMNKPLYVWNTSNEQWFTWNGTKFIKTETPILTKDFAGIGTRDIETYYGQRKAPLASRKQEAARQAIRDVYQKTKDSLKEVTTAQSNKEEIKPSTTQTNEDNNLGLDEDTRNSFQEILHDLTDEGESKNQLIPIRIRGWAKKYNVTEDMINKEIQDYFDSFGSTPNAKDLLTEKADLIKDVTADNIVSEFDAIPKGTDKTHNTFLRNFVSHVIAPVVEQTELLLFSKATYTYGQYSAELKKVAINLGQAMSKDLDPFQMSAQEVFAHEFVHAVQWAAYGLYDNKHIRNIVDTQFYKLEHEFNKYKARNQDDKSLDKWDGYVFNNKDFIDVTVRNTTTGKPMVVKYNRGVQEFLAFGSTNKEFRELLTKLKSRQLKVTEVSASTISDEVREATWIEVISNVLKKVLDSFIKVAKGKDSLEPLIMFDKNVRLILAANGKAGYLNTTVPVVDRGDAFISEKAKDVGLKTLKFVAKGRGSKIQFVDALGKYADTLPAIGGFETNKVIRETIKLIKNENIRNLLLDQVNDIKGTTKANKPLENAILNQGTIEGERNTATAKDVQEYQKKVGVLNDLQDTAFKNVVLSGELFSVRDSYPTNFIELLEDSKALNQEIKSLEVQIHKLVNDTKNLASMMVLGKYTETGLGKHNAALVAKQGRNIPQDKYQKELDLVTKLSRLYAIGLQDVNHVNEIVKLLKDKPQAMNEVMNVHRENVKKAHEEGHALTIHDGEIPTSYNPFRSIYLGTKEDEKFLVEHWGATIIGNLERDPNDPLTTLGILYLITEKTQQDYDSKAMAFVSRNSESSNFHSGFTMTDRFKAAENREKAKLKDDGTKSTNNIKQKNTSNVSRVAIFNQQGKVIRYEYTLDKATKDKYLKPTINAFKDLATQKNAITYINEATKLNNQLVDKLYNYWKDLGHKARHDMIWVGSEGKYKDLWNMIPTETKAYFETKFGTEKGFYMAEEELRTVFGYRKQTITNWIQPVLEDDLKRHIGNHIYYMAKRLGFNLATITAMESMWIEGISFAKDTIVVKSGVVSAANESSNFMTAKLKGTPIPFYYQSKIRAMKAEQQFRRDSDALLSHLSNAYGNPDYITEAIDHEMNKLKSAISNNPMSFLHEEGLASTIAEENAHKDKHETKLYSKTERARNLFDKLPKVVKDTLKVATISEGTKVYTLMNEIAQMGDITSRFAFIEWEAEKAKRNGTKFDYESAIDKAKFLFVQYHSVTNDKVQWGNDIGLIMFSKFGTKAIGVLAHMFGNHAGRLLALGILEDVLGASDWIWNTGMNKFAIPTSSLFAAIDASPIANALITPPAYIPKKLFSSLGILPVVSGL